MEQVHRESLEQEATHATDEARMVLPGIQAFLGFQLVAVFNQRFELLTFGEQVAHLTAFLMIAIAMALCMAPAAYHRIAERGVVSRRFVAIASSFLSIAMLPLVAGVTIDTYLITLLILEDRETSLGVAVGLGALLFVLWFVLPLLSRRRRPARNAPNLEN